MIHYSKVDGRVFHDEDCTWCQFRTKVPFMEGKKKREMEICKVHQKRCAPVGDVNRYCEEFRQVSCDCPRCKPDTNAFDERLDKS